MKKLGKLIILSFLFSLFTFAVSYAQDQDFSIVEPSFVGWDSSVKKGSCFIHSFLL